MTIEETGLDDERHARKRAAVALASIVGVAVVVVTLLVALTGRPPKSNPAPGAQDVPVATSVASSSSRAQPSASSSAATAPSSRRAASRTAPVPAGDTGRVLQAFNTFRSRHGVRPVSGSVTSAAIDCAASQGDPSACPSSYFWEPVPSADGAQVVEKISRHSQGTDWLLDPRIKRLEIGWKSAGGGWDCAVVATY